MIIDNNVLKCDSQYPRLIHVLAILTRFSKHLLFLIISLRCFHEILSDPRVNELLHLLMAIVNSSLEKEFHNEYDLEESSSNNDIFTH